MTIKTIKFQRLSSSYLNKIKKELQTKYEAEIDIKKTWNYFANDQLLKSTNKEEENLKFLIKTLNSLDKQYLRSKQQILFHKHFIGIHNFLILIKNK